MTLSAAMLVLSGPWWGREVDRIGVHAVLVRGLVLATIGSTGFAVDDRDRRARGAAPMAGAGGFALTRGVLYGLGFAAVPVAA